MTRGDTRPLLQTCAWAEFASGSLENLFEANHLETSYKRANVRNVNGEPGSVLSNSYGKMTRLSAHNLQKRSGLHT